MDQGRCAVDAPAAFAIRSAPASESCPAPRLDAADLLAVASRAAAAAACAQAPSILTAARMLQAVARDRGSLWLAGEAAAEHARRLEAAGQRALVAESSGRLPERLGSLDALVIATSGEPPRALLAEARRRRVDILVLAGPSGIDHEGDIVVRVPCYDRRALELAHGFILEALCALGSDPSQAAAMEPGRTLDTRSLNRA